MTTNSKWYHNVWMVLLLLFFVLGPFGLPLVWKHPRFSRGIKLALTAAMAVYTVALVDMTVRATKHALQMLQDLPSGF